MQFEEFFTGPLANVPFATELELNFAEVFDLLLKNNNHFGSEEDIFDEICNRLSLCSELNRLTINCLPFDGHFVLTTQQVEKFCRALQSCTKLKSLEIDVYALDNLTSQDRQLIYQSFSSLQKLEEFSMIDVLYTLEQDDMEALSQSLVACKSLKTLSFSLGGADSIPDETLDELFNMISLLHLENLKIYDLDLEQLTILHWQTLCNALSASGTLKSIFIDTMINSYYVDDNFGEFVDSLSSITSLEELALVKASLHLLSVSEWNILATGLSKLKLRVLNLDENKLENSVEEDLIAFGEFISKLRFLKTISLNRDEEDSEDEDEEDEFIVENNFTRITHQLTKSETLEKISMLGCLNFLEDDDIDSIGTDLMALNKLKTITLDDCRTIVCNALARISNLEAVDFGDYYARNPVDIPAGNDFLKGLISIKNLRYVRGLDSLAAEKLRVLYDQPNSPLLLNSHPAYSQQTLYHARVIKAWYASIADFLLRGGIHTNHNTILDAILEFWLPPNEKVLIEIMKKGREYLMTFDEYDMTPIKPQVPYTLYEPLIFRVRAGVPSYLTTEKKSADSDLLMDSDLLSFDDARDESETKVAASLRLSK